MYSPFLFPDTSPDFFPYSLYTVATSLISLPLMQSSTFIIKSSKSSLCYVFLLHSVRFILPISKDLYLVTTHHPTIPSLPPSQASSSLFLWCLFPTTLVHTVSLLIFFSLPFSRLLLDKYLTMQHLILLCIQKEIRYETSGISSLYLSVHAIFIAGASLRKKC